MAQSHDAERRMGFLGQDDGMRSVLEAMSKRTDQELHGFCHGIQLCDAKLQQAGVRCCAIWESLKPFRRSKESSAISDDIFLPPPHGFTTSLRPLRCCSTRAHPPLHRNLWHAGGMEQRWQQQFPSAVRPYARYCTLCSCRHPGPFGA